MAAQSDGDHNGTRQADWMGDAGWVGFGLVGANGVTRRWRGAVVSGGQLARKAELKTWHA